MYIGQNRITRDAAAPTGNHHRLGLGAHRPGGAGPVYSDSGTGFASRQLPESARPRSAAFRRHGRAQTWTRQRNARSRFLTALPGRRRSLEELSSGGTRTPQITPMTRAFLIRRGDWMDAPGLSTGERGRRPGAGASLPGKQAPPRSQGKDADARFVAVWMDSGYLTRAAHDTRHRLSCLATSTCPVSRRGAGGTRAR